MNTNQPTWWLSQGRERKARVYDFASVMLLLSTTSALGALAYFAAGGR